MENDHPRGGGADGGDRIKEDLPSTDETDQWATSSATRKGRHDSMRITLQDSDQEEDEDEDDRRNMTGSFYHGRNRRYSGSYDNVYEESTVV